MSQYDNLLKSKDETIKSLFIGLAITFFLAFLMGTGWFLSPNFLRIHIPPDLSRSVELEVGEIRKANVYAFTFYIWQQLNRWRKNGEEDYEDNIHKLKHYMTPLCFANRLDDFEVKKTARELRDRERTVREIPGRNFSTQRVLLQSSDVWVVYLDLEIEESYLGETVKDRYVNYPLRVVRYDVDPELNPWGLALDCFADIPRVINLEQPEGD